jgi:hypothetical protein
MARVGFPNWRPPTMLKSKTAALLGQGDTAAHKNPIVRNSTLSGYHAPANLRKSRLRKPDPLLAQMTPENRNADGTFSIWCPGCNRNTILVGARGNFIERECKPCCPFTQKGGAK